MNVLMVSPGFPEDMPYFTRALAARGARVVGLGDQHVDALPHHVRDVLSHYVHVENLWHDDSAVASTQAQLGGISIDRVETLWEPAMHLAARLRGVFGAPGLTVEQTRAFRDKVEMKALLAAAGVRTPRCERATTAARVRELAEGPVGYPLVLKPVAGAGAADTLRVDDAEELERALEQLRHVPEISVEEFIDGEEYTYDTLSVGGVPAYENIAWYRPKPLTARLEAWISPQAIALRDLDAPHLQAGRDLGRRVLEVLGFQDGFTHMEWFLNGKGEAVFGEIGGRSPGGRLTHAMNYVGDVDLFSGWAEVVCERSCSLPDRRDHNVALIFKRSQGGGRIRHHYGLGELMAEYGEHVAHIDLVPVGEPSRDWTQVVTADGWIVVRHPDLDRTLEIADRFAADLQIVAE